MIYEFKLPDIGEGVHEATLLEWKREVGDAVEEGEVLAVVETDKVAAEIPSPRSGVIRELGARVEQVIQVGEMLAQIEISTAGQTTSREDASVAITPGESTSVVGSVASAASLLEASSEGVAGGLPAGSSASADNRRARAASGGKTVQKPRATPVARRLAAKEGIELSSVRGSGPSGRILKEDILKKRESRGNGGNPSIGIGEGDRRASSMPEGAPFKSSRVRELSTLRRTVARNLEASWRIPAAVIHDFAVADDLVAARADLNREAGSSSHPKLSFLPFFIKAAALSVKHYPVLNASYDERRQVVEPHGAANIGFALDSEEGLVVPVIQKADRLTLSEIQELINRRRSEASERNLRIEHLRGGTFTLSNYGSIGGIYGRPLILPPQVAILGLGRIHQAPVARDGRLTAAAILPLSFVFDHRVCDGSYAVRFLNDFMELISKPIRILR
jgi:pyruvate dehydrogenase E2 component (dihydrolipoamide acetyltransferase)